MSEPDDELELQALQRRLDDAFATTRPRPGFDDELWLRVQAQRPAGSRLRGLLAGLAGGIRAVPALPAAGVAAVLIVAIGIGLANYGGLIGSHTSMASESTTGGAALAPQAGAARAPGSYGALPLPSFAGGVAVPANPDQAASGVTAPNASRSWTGQLNVTITSAPVFRYQEPSPASADQFAATLGAVLQSRPDGFLGSYETADYTLKVRGTVKAPPSAPAYFILSALTMKSVEVAGQAPVDVAGIFLAEHNLTPPWPYAVSVDSTSSSLVKVRFGRQFSVPGYGLATLVDASGAPYGLEVDLNGSQPALASGLMPLPLESTMYPIIGADQAVRLALATPASPSGSGAPAPSSSGAAAPSSGGAAAPSSGGSAVTLTKAELVYVLVPAGDHSFFEPAYLFSGTSQAGGTAHVQRVLVPAVQ